MTMTLFLLLSACFLGPKPEPAPDEPDTGVAACTPDIEVLPGSVDFGDVELGASAIETVTVANVGCADLEIAGVTLADTDGASDLAISAVGSAVLAPGGATSFTVTFTPTSAESVANAVQIASNDEDEPQVEVSLLATGLAPELLVGPAACEFVDVPIGCSEECEVTVSNAGTADLVVYGAQLDGTAAEFSLAVDAPDGVTLAPGSSFTLTVAYTPSDEIDDAGSVTIYSDDPVTHEATVSASGTATAAVETCE